MTHASTRTSSAVSLITVALLTAFAPHAVAAQDSALHIATLEQGGWPQTVAALEANPSAQGATVHVVVFDDAGHSAPCGHYGLTLDDAGARAFAIGQCDPMTSATALSLVSRTQLFAHDGPVPRPLAIRLFASEVRLGDAAGGAAMTGGAALDCSVGVRPYLDDLEHGGVVYLGPDRYEVRPHDTSIRVEVGASQWSLRARTRTSLTIPYDVIERATGQVVISDQATLTCSDRTSTASAPPPVTAEPVHDPRADRVVILQGTDLPQMAEVVGVIDMHEPSGDEATALRLLRERAAQMGADAVIGVEFHHGEEGGPTHLSGMAVRFVTLARAS